MNKEIKMTFENVIEYAKNASKVWNNISECLKNKDVLMIEIKDKKYAIAFDKGFVRVNERLLGAIPVDKRGFRYGDAVIPVYDYIEDDASYRKEQIDDNTYVIIDTATDGVYEVVYEDERVKVELEYGGFRTYIDGELYSESVDTFVEEQYEDCCIETEDGDIVFPDAETERKCYIEYAQSLANALWEVVRMKEAAAEVNA